jgi:serine/threonine protein kinase
MNTDQLCMGCMTDRGQSGVCATCGWQDPEPDQTPLVLPLRTVLHDQYLVGRVLGHGGFGITYLAWDVNLEIRVAIKEHLPSDLATRSTDRKTVTPFSGKSKEYFEYGLSKFLDEAKAIARFNDHPGIVSVLNFFRENGTGYLVMSYVDGVTLKEYLQERGGRVPYTAGVRLLMPVMDALRTVHAANMLHRDISPDNIFITTGGQVKLLDFGAARYAMSEKSQSLSVMLKPGYAPGEQYRSKGHQGPWTDVYALGATLYRTITGLTPSEALDREKADDLEVPSAMDVEIPAEGEAAVVRALAVSQEKRYQTVDEFQTALLRTVRTVHAEDEAVYGEDRPGRAHLANASRAPMQALTLPAALEHVVGPVAKGCERITKAIASVPPRLRPAPTLDDSVRTASAVVAGLLGLGRAWSAITTIGIMGSLGGTFGLGPLLTLAGLVSSVVLVLGALLGLVRDPRATPIAWVAAWCLAAIDYVGFLLYCASMVSAPIWAQMDAATQSAIIVSALRTMLWAVVPAAIVLFLLWKGGFGAGARPAAPDKAEVR